MATRTHLVNSVKIFNPGPVYKVDYPPLGGYLSFGDKDTKPLDLDIPIVEKMDDPTTRFKVKSEFVSSLGSRAFDIMPNTETNPKFETLRVLPDPANCCIITPHPATNAYHTTPGMVGRIEGAQYIDLSYFQPVESLKSGWFDGYDGEYASLYMGTWPLLMQRDGSTPDATSGLETLFEMHPFPVFCFALGRPEPPDGMTNTPGTWVEFSKSSDASFALWLPYSGECAVYYKHKNNTNGEWRVLPKLQGGAVNAGEIHNPNWKAAQDVEPTLIWVGWFGYRIVISTDGFASNNAVFSTQISDPYYKNTGTNKNPVWKYQPYGDCLESVASSVTFRHCGGKWEIAWIPIYMHEWGGLQSPVHKTPYNITTHISAVNTERSEQSPPLPPGVKYHIVSDSILPGDNVKAQTCEYWNTRAGKISPAGVYGLDYEVMLYSGVWESCVYPEVGLNYPNYQQQLAFPDQQVFKFYYHDWSPVLYRTDYYLEGVLKENLDVSGITTATPAFTQNVKSFEFQRTDGSGTGSVVLDPNDAALQDLHNTSLRYAIIDPYFTDAAGNPTTGNEKPAYAGYTHGLQTTLKGKATGQLQMYDVLAAASEFQLDATLPPFDGWYVKDAILFLLSYAAIGPELMKSYYYRRLYSTDLYGWGTDTTFEDLGTRLNVGDPQKPLWVAEKGSSPIELAREMCFYDYGAALWCDNGAVWKGCPNCRFPRMTTSNWGYVTEDEALSHLDNGYASTGCLKYDGKLAEGVYTGDTSYSIEDGVHFRYFSDWTEIATYHDVNGLPLINELLSIETAPMEVQSEYYNAIRVEGHSMVRPDMPWAQELVDWKSVHGDADALLPLGRKRTLTISREWINSQAIMNRICYIAAKRSMAVNKYVDITVPYDPRHKLGRVFAVHGPLTDVIWARNKKFRILSVAASGNTGQVPPGISQLRGVLIGDAEAPGA